MDGYLLSYKPLDNASRVVLNHVLFGRLAYKTYRGKKYTYYTPGILHDVHFERVENGKIFLMNIEKINMEELRIFGDVEAIPCTRDVDIGDMVTGEEHWKNKARARGLDFRVRRN